MSRRARSGGAVPALRGWRAGSLGPDADRRAALALLWLRGELVGAQRHADRPGALARLMAGRFSLYAALAKTYPQIVLC